MLAFAFASGDDKKPPILSESAIQADAACGGAITQAIKDTEFKASAGSSLTVRCADGAVVIIGAGKAFTPGKEAEDIGGHITAALAKNSLIKATLMIDSDDAAIISGIGLGAVLAAYKFSHYFTKGDKAKPKQRKLTITSPLGRKALTAFKAEKELAEGVFLARDLVYEPANMLYPESFAKRCKMLENECGLKVEVLDEKAMKKEGMDLLLSVGQGSTKKSQMVIMRWDGGKKGEKPLALIGKGVCFDTGGISIKPAGGMEDMKWDMGGAAAVTGAMRSIAGRKLKRNVIGLIGLVENMPDGNATRPGDVVKSMSGQTVEIINTDAEGRLVLADVLTYTLRHFEPEKMVNLATLTGAIIVSLGKEHAGLFSNDDDLSGAITAAGLDTGEKAWRMPLGKDYDDLLKSHIADMKNIGGRWAGSITAACFLERFVEGVPWAHIDIAGMAWADKSRPTVPSGGTGYGVRMLTRFVENGA
ncbi:MAG TPA: leucyl aminopeptidase [Alphaproteobacteria bacterium]|nr:leucyl aminopeptidase [Alphaproteobacteria bacterium]HCV63166.1 leucyl aminopeptidase [Alphaproteobacteria bacterium]|tara:strand:- start:2358 stop:3782 length:1425 start_codon:yes stop_codon:yes gene_type:complete